MSAEFLAELDMIDVPLFLLTDRPGGPIKKRWAAPTAWQKRTTEQNAAVLADWRPGMAVAALTGHLFDVIDVDPRDGGTESLAQLARDGAIPKPLFVAATMSGGYHILVPPTGMKNSASEVLPGIDMRTRGGFILVAPTEGYRVLPRDEWPELGAQPADAVERLRGLARRDVPLPEQTVVAGPVTPQEREKAENGLLRVLRIIREADGGRNNATSRSLFLLYGFVKAGALDRDDVDDRVWDAVQEAPGDHEYTREEFDASRESAWGAARAQRPRVESAGDAFGVVRDEPEGGPFQRTSLRELLDQNRPPREWVVNGLLLAGTATAFIAAAGHRKSLVALSASLAVARGDAEWAGLPITRGRRVAYIDMENTEDDLRDRLLSFGITEDVDNFILLSMPSMKPLDTAAGGAEFLAALDAFGMEPGDLVVLDSYQRITEAGENDSDTTRAFYRHTGIGLKQRGLTVIRTDNTGKDATRGARGSSGKRDDVDVEYVITSTGDLIEFKPTKARQGGIEMLTVRVVIQDGHTAFTSSHGDTRRRAAMDECVAWLDQREVDPQLGNHKTEKLVAGLFTRVVVHAAIKARRERAEAFDDQP
jgi:hypothetical protein